MATYIDNIVKFHTFSKSPVSKDTTLGGAVNPSGHTVTTSQVRAQDIPAFLNTFQGTREQAITWLGNNYPTPAHNDIVFYGGEFKAGFSTPKCLKWNAKLETPTWEDFDITTAATLKNADDKDVIAVHQNCTTVFVDGSNNAATNSNRNSLFVKKADGSILDHFVASTDKIVAGMPSLGYNALVLWNGAAIDEGELDANYIGNTFAGIVHLNKQYSTGDDAKFKVTCFEYIGDKLNATVAELKAAIFGEGGSDGEEDTSLSQKVAQNTAAINTLNGDATTVGSIAKSIKDAIDALIVELGDVAVKDDITITDIKVQIGDGEATPLTPDENKSVTIEVQAATTDVAGVVTISDNNAIATTETTSTAAATVAAVAATRSEIAGEIGALAGTVSSNKTEVDGKISAIEEQLGATGTTGKAIQAAQETADEALGLAQTAVQSVASAEGSSTLLTVNDGNDGTEVTISLSTEVATKTDAATAASTAITTSLAGTTDDTIGGAISSAVSGLKTELTTGDGSLGTRVTNLENSVSVITTTTIPAAIASAKTQTLETEVTPATGKDDETAPKVTVQLSGTVQTPELTVTTADIASAQALAALETKVDNFHKAGVSYQVLQSLPPASATYNGVVVLVPASTDDDPTAIVGAYVEHLCVNKGTEESPEWVWERIGTTEADFTQYAKTADLEVAETIANGLTYSQNNGLVKVSVAKASTSQVGTVQLTDAYTSTDDTQAATGKSIAAAIATLATSAPVGDGAVKVSQTDGIVTSVSVATETLVENGAIKA